MSALCPQDLEEVRTKLRRGNQILFTRDSGCLQPLLSLIRRQSHRTLVLWALEGCRPPLALLARRWPGEQRPVQAVQAARLWAQGRIKMPAARRAILAAHAAAKETADPVSIALCHAIGQACGTVHVETHAIGLAMYELTALVRLGLEGSAALPAASSLPCEPLCHEEITLPLSRRLETYARRLLYWEQAVNAHPGPWAPFLLKDGPNREQQRYEKQQHLKEAPPW